jgi:hypothetical protein
MNQEAEPVYIRKVLGYLFEPGQVVELRAPQTSKGTISGYFDDMEKLAGAATELSGNVPGVYVTLNPINPTLFARAANKLIRYAKHTTSDKDIIKRRWLPIDFDPIRPAGISSNDGEHLEAIERAKQAKAWLEKDLGFPSLVLADSGNGGHVLGRIDLPNDQESTSIIEKCLQALAVRFTDDRVTVDLTTFNAARIWKLYGTLACKGDSVADRPHRGAKFLRDV